MLVVAWASTPSSPEATIFMPPALEHTIWVSVGFKMGDAMATPMNSANQTRTSLARNRWLGPLNMLTLCQKQKKATPFGAASFKVLQGFIGPRLRSWAELTASNLCFCSQWHRQPTSTCRPPICQLTHSMRSSNRPWSHTVLVRSSVCQLCFWRLCSKQIPIESCSNHFDHPPQNQICECCSS